MSTSITYTIKTITTTERQESKVSCRPRVQPVILKGIRRPGNGPMTQIVKEKTYLPTFSVEVHQASLVLLLSSRDVSRGEQMVDTWTRLSPSTLLLPLESGL
ncbi:hypothetical protein NN561_020045 [Cricetulus griseus]